MHSKLSQYADENNNIKMCNSCKRVKAAKEPYTWILDTILYVEPPDNVIYETCCECLENECQEK
ncbi:MAG: hypothetical protein ACPHLK_03300 [Gammaproteobacteria bacterium]|jgi:hypothetical protein